MGRSVRRKVALSGSKHACQGRPGRLPGGLRVARGATARSQRVFTRGARPLFSTFSLFPARHRRARHELGMSGALWHAATRTGTNVDSACPYSRRAERRFCRAARAFVSMIPARRKNPFWSLCFNSMLDHRCRPLLWLRAVGPPKACSSRRPPFRGSLYGQRLRCATVSACSPPIPHTRSHSLRSSKIDASLGCLHQWTQLPTRWRCRDSEWGCFGGRQRSVACSIRPNQPGIVEQT